MGFHKDFFISFSNSSRAVTLCLNPRSQVSRPPSPLAYKMTLLWLIIVYPRYVSVLFHSLFRIWFIHSFIQRLSHFGEMCFLFLTYFICAFTYAIYSLFVLFIMRSARFCYRYRRCGTPPRIVNAPRCKPRTYNTPTGTGKYVVLICMSPPYRRRL